MKLNLRDKNKPLITIKRSTLETIEIALVIGAVIYGFATMVFYGYCMEMNL